MLIIGNRFAGLHLFRALLSGSAFDMVEQKITK
jgi:hypothetical protein